MSKNPKEDKMKRFLAATAATVLIMTGCVGSEGPEDVAKNMMEAVSDGDFQKMKELVAGDIGEIGDVSDGGGGGSLLDDILPLASTDLTKRFISIKRSCGKKGANTIDVKCIRNNMKIGKIEAINVLDTKENGGADKKIVRLELEMADKSSKKVELSVELIKKEWKVSHYIDPTVKQYDQGR
jgi:hypothetical protein